MSRHHARLDWRRWARVRRAVFRRDGYRCVRCHKAGRSECDHVIPLDTDPDQDPYDIDGCQTLCRSCHIAKTAAENRGDMMPGRKEWLELVSELLEQQRVI